MPSCPTLCNLIYCSPPGSPVHGDSPGKNTGVGCQALLQGIFPTQGSNPDLLHCRWILYHLSHQGSIYIFPHGQNILSSENTMNSENIDHWTFLQWNLELLHKIVILWYLLSQWCVVKIGNTRKYLDYKAIKKLIIH